MSPLDNLKAVLCDPEGKASIEGSVEDLRIIDESLKQLDSSIIIAVEKAEELLNRGSIKTPEEYFDAIQRFQDESK